MVHRRSIFRLPVVPVMVRHCWSSKVSIRVMKEGKTLLLINYHLVTKLSEQMQHRPISSCIFTKPGLQAATMRLHKKTNIREEDHCYQIRRRGL
ncbi:hypothetical protein B0T13DRAFT_467292 [Neurospora crassa]|nr:hypothetical protein B0T13DRAFT_467292 [Neurospora crassa]